MKKINFEKHQYVSPRIIPIEVESQQIFCGSIVEPNYESEIEAYGVSEELGWF